MKEASFWEKRDENVLQCLLCRHHCIIAEGKRGICGVRENRDGTLYSLVYGFPCADHVDPIEKKPLFHFYPGTKAFSIATVGCNFRCLHCQNHEISQSPRETSRVFGRNVPHEDIVKEAKATRCTSISYTYTEPTVFFEYAFDIMKIARREGIANNFVTNGYIEEGPLKAIAPYLDAANIDLKGFSESFYGKVCGAKLSGVLDTVRLHRKLGIWIELTTLVIPGHNDGDEELASIARFIAQELGPEVPWHVSAFYPTYRLLDSPPTSVKTLARARQIGIEAGLRYVYVGNIPGLDGENTCCPTCHKTIIGRYGYSITEYNLKGGACSFCGSAVDGVGL